ncbi:unnamed protein product [Allacma fusca]|uniref:Uncharacterized protein n=1 Tax=Allacma fusca TaxID=39272 RepID=A0A8J2KSI7_9HEXA|nr:unnamed protein product [Allacma fusca]
MGPMFSPHKESHFVRPSIEATDDEEAFLVEHPLEILAQGKAQRVPWMAGVNADEGLLTSLCNVYTYMLCS